MKNLFLFFIFTILLIPAKAQEYRLGYDGKSLPELYERTNIFVEVRKGNEFIIVSPRQYRLTTRDARLSGNVLTYDRAKIYQDSGLVNFNLSIGGRNVPLSLNLPVLEDIYFNMYTDSIKPILNYYVNLEGKFSNGRVFPLDTSFATITADQGTMNGYEWILPKEHNFDSVTFVAISKLNPAITKSKTLYLKKYKDPRDDPNYQDRTEEEIINSRRRR